MNYWALKQSVTKYNKGLFKIIKKFRQYLNQKIDLSKSSTQLAKQLSSQTLANSNLTLSKKDLNQLVHTDELNDDKYFNKMKIICKKSLHLKCSKYNFNRSLAEFTAETYSVFYDLNQISQKLTVEYEKDKKENGAKFKKDIKNLLSQKLKYISDLMKQLTHLGLSYRRGNLTYSAQHENINQILSFEPCLYSFQQDELITSNFNQTNFAYYVCLDLFVSFKQLLDLRVINPTKGLI